MYLHQPLFLLCYKKAADFMAGTQIRTALVSTNSVSQSESVALLWKPLFAEGVHIDFAHRTFRWDSEAKSKAHVHCVIIGYSCAPNEEPRVIYTDNRPQIVNNIIDTLLMQIMFLSRIAASRYAVFRKSALVISLLMMEITYLLKTKWRLSLQVSHLQQNGLSLGMEPRSLSIASRDSVCGWACVRLMSCEKCVIVWSALRQFVNFV